MMKRELSLSPEPVTTIVELRQWMQDAWDNLSQDDIRHLYDHLHARIHACVAAREGTLCIDVNVWAPLIVTVVFIWSEFVIIYSYNKDGQPAVSMWHTQMKIARNLPFPGNIIPTSVSCPT